MTPDRSLTKATESMQRLADVLKEIGPIECDWPWDSDVPMLHCQREFGHEGAHRMTLTNNEIRRAANVLRSRRG